MRTIVKGVRGHSRHQLVAFDVDVDIDVNRLANLLGQKALQNLSGRTSLAQGLIRVTVRSKPEPVR